MKKIFIPLVLIAAIVAAIFVMQMSGDITKVSYQPRVSKISSGRTACAQCAGTICLGSSCNFDCEYGGEWCQTIVMGGGGSGFQRGMTDYAEFVLSDGFFYVMRNSQLMEDAGINIADIVVSIDDQEVTTLEEFAALVEILESGKKIKVIKINSSVVTYML